MGYASYLEDITDKAHDNRYMRAGYELKTERKPVFVAASPPLQPVLAGMVIPLPARPDAETLAKRERALCEKHILALHELMPGYRWRH